MGEKKKSTLFFIHLVYLTSFAILFLFSSHFKALFFFFLCVHTDRSREETHKITATTTHTQKKGGLAAFIIFFFYWSSSSNFHAFLFRGFCFFFFVDSLLLLLLFSFPFYLFYTKLKELKAINSTQATTTLL